MTDTYKTQCPNCQAVYKVGIKQLAIGYKKARCKRCKYQFVMRDNLVTESLIAQNKSPPTPSKTTTTTLKPDTPSHKPDAPSRENSKTISFDEDGLFHDDMDVDNELEEAEEFNKLQDEWSEESLIHASRVTNNKDTSTFFENEDEDEDEEKDWLGALLSTSNQATESNIDEPIYADDTDNTNRNNNEEEYDNNDDEVLNNLLDELGVDTADVAIPDHEQSMQRMQQRLQTKAIGTNKRNKKPLPIILLWSLGCLGLIALLPAQYMWFNLDNLAKDTTTRPKVETFCKVAFCTVPGTDLTKFAIPNKTFKTNPDNSNQSDIIATLVNKSDGDQLYPALKVSIYSDTSLIGDFIAQPEDYLAVPQRLMSSHKVELFMLRVDLPTQNIARIDIEPLY